VTSFPGRDLDDDAEWNKLWRRFRLHEEKLGNALLHAWWDDLFDLAGRGEDPDEAERLVQGAWEAVSDPLDDDR
jgi:hypothetical protein